MLLVFVLASAVYLVVFRYSYFDVSYIEVTGTHSFVNQNDLLKVAQEKINGSNIFFVNVDELEANFLEVFKGAKYITMTRRLPDKIIIEVGERVPLAVIYKKAGSDFFLIDEDGYVLGLVDEEKTNLPEIQYSGEIKIGSLINEEVVPVYIELIKALDNEKIMSSSISVEKNYIRFFVKDSIEVLVDVRKNMWDSVAALSQVLGFLSQRGTPARKVDLRYDKVIVSYE